MQSVTVTRDNWFTLVDEAGLRLEHLAVATGKSFSAVYRYKQGTRTAPDVWLEQVAQILADRAMQEEGVAS